MAFLRRAVIAAIAIFSSVSVQAAELPALLDMALSRGEAANSVRWGFTQNFENANANLTMRFSPAEESGNWSLLAPTSLNHSESRVYDAMSDLVDDPDPDSDLTYEQLRTAIGGQQVRVLEDSPTHTVYGFAPLPWDDVEEDEEAFIQHMLAELTVDKSGAYISRIRMYAPETFRAMMVARIDSFEQEMIFALEPHTGLPLMVSLSQNIEGRAMMQNINRWRVERFSDFVPHGNVARAASCTIEICNPEFLAAE